MLSAAGSLTVTVSPRSIYSSVPGKVTNPRPDTFTNGAMTSDSSCPTPPENSTTPAPVTFAVAFKTKLPSLQRGEES